LAVESVLFKPPRFCGIQNLGLESSAICEDYYSAFWGRYYMLKSRILILGLSLASACATAPAATVHAEGEHAKPAQVSEVERRADAKQTLSANPDTVAVYAKGMCCPSCAIGIRVKLSSLVFVDSERFDGGIKLNAKTQLVTVAIRPGQAVNRQALSLMVRRAGFDPVDYFWLENGELKGEPLSRN
jgi:hypothetical protein